MELNREQIIKALERCKTPSANDCNGCEYDGKCLKNGEYIGCVNLLVADALSLIKELAEKNKNLEQAYECADSARRELSSECDRLTEENERLRGEWISVEDRLPKWNGLYLTFQSNKPCISNFDAQKQKFGVWWHYTPDGRYEKNYRFIESDNITHWMPLTEPKGE